MKTKNSATVPAGAIRIRSSKIKTPPPSDEYRANYDAVFGRHRRDPGEEEGGIGAAVLRKLGRRND